MLIQDIIPNKKKIKKTRNKSLKSFSIFNYHLKGPSTGGEISKNATEVFNKVYSPVCRTGRFLALSGFEMTKKILFRFYSQQKLIVFSLAFLMIFPAVAGVSFLSLFQETRADQPESLDISETKIKEKYDKSELKGKYKLEKASFIKKAKDENAIQTEVGNKNLDEFTPELNLRKWNDEVNFKVKYKHEVKKKDQIVELEGNKIKWKGDKTEVHYYEMKKGELLHGEELESDVYEVEVILLEKPKTNLVGFDIETKGLKFYYQPPLNEEMNDPTCTPTDCQNSHRPENVVGSYAVYHSTKKDHIVGQKNYMTGKAFHIYRPKIIDSAGTEVWGVLNITDNLLTVEIPQEFLDNAIYPVRHAAGLGFGFDVNGSSNENIGGDVILGSKFTGAAGTGVSIKIYQTNNLGGTADVKCGIYTHSNSGFLTNSETEELTCQFHEVTKTFNFNTAPTLTAVDYVLVAWAHNCIGWYLDYDSGDTDQGHEDSETFGTFPATASFTHNNNKHSIYCTYTSPPTISSGSLASDNSYVDIVMSEGMYNTSGGSGALETTDFALTFTQNGGNATAASISAVTKTDGNPLTGGETTIRANLSITGTPSGAETVEIKPVATSIYNAAGTAMADTETTGAKTLNDELAPTISSVTLSPSTGTLKIGDEVVITVTPGNGESGLSSSDATFNSQAVPLTEDAGWLNETSCNALAGWAWLNGACWSDSIADEVSWNKGVGDDTSTTGAYTCNTAGTLSSRMQAAVVGYWSEICTSINDRTITTADNGATGKPYISALAIADCIDGTRDIGPAITGDPTDDRQGRSDVLDAWARAAGHSALPAIKLDGTTNDYNNACTGTWYENTSALSPGGNYNWAAACVDSGEWNTRVQVLGFFSCPSQYHLDTSNTGNACSFRAIMRPVSTYTGTYTVIEGHDDIENPQTTGIILTDTADNASSPGSCSSTLIIDATVPTVNITAPVTGAKVKGTTLITFTDDESTNPQCSIDNNVWVACITNTTALSDITGFDSLSNGTFTLYLKDTDTAGNIGTDTETGIVKDASTPDISAIDAGLSSLDRTSLTSDTWFKYSDTGSDDQISFSWTDPSSPSDDTFYYELNADSGNTITGDESTTANPYIDDVTITEGTNYFHAKPKNGADTWGTERTFIVKYDKTAPSNIAISSITADSSSQLTIISSIATDSDSGLHNTPYWFNGTTDGSGATDSIVWQNSTSFIDNGLSANTQYTYQVKAKDAMENESSYSSTLSKYTLANVPASLSLVADSSTQITASWNANSNSANTEYYIENTIAGTNSGWTTSVSWISSDLDCGTSYSFKVKARNGDNTETVFTDTTSVETQGCSGGMPPGTFNPPVPPEPTPENPEAKFGVLINNNDEYANNPVVTLKLSVGSNTTRMAISNTPDFKYASIIPYQPEITWNLCEGQEEGICKNTLHVTGYALYAYAKFYTQYGVASEVVSGSIILKTIITETEETTNTETKEQSKDSNQEEPMSETEENKNPESSKNTTPDKTNPSKPSSFIFTKTLKLGSYGTEVTHLQNRLKELNFFSKEIKSSSNFGLIIEQAVKEYQKSKEIYPCGIVGPRTRKALNNEEFITNKDYKFTKDLKYNDKNEEVKQLQTRLRDQNFFPYNIRSTSWFGPITQKAVNIFQKFYNLIQSGVVDEGMRRVLNR